MLQRLLVFLIVVSVACASCAGTRPRGADSAQPSSEYRGRGAGCRPRSRTRRGEARRPAGGPRPTCT